MHIDRLGVICEDEPVAREAQVDPSARVPLPSGLGHLVPGEDPPMEHPSDGGPARPSTFTREQVLRRAVRS